MNERPEISLGTLCLDCHDAQAMADFYAGLLAWEPTFVEEDWILMRNPDGGVGLSFQAEEKYVPPVWPEQRSEQQKMMHLDVRVTGRDAGELDGEDGEAALDAAAQVAVAAGGRLADHQPREDLRIILDPAGHPLCLFLR
jgi:catechol 2,3-dioxygenase-like lactoylglutathione lyase family enzyme